MRESLFIAPFAGQRVIHIRHGDQLCADGDIVALQPVRVSPAVPALVVPAGDLVGGLQQRLVCKAFSLLQHLCAQHTVGLDHRKFFCGQLAGLVQDGFVNADLADIVQCRRQRDVILLLGSQVVAAGSISRCSSVSVMMRMCRT